VPIRCPNSRGFPVNAGMPLGPLGDEKPPLCRHIPKESALHVLLAMQKVEGSNPFSRFAVFRSTERLGACVTANGCPLRAVFSRSSSVSVRNPGRDTFRSISNRNWTLFGPRRATDAVVKMKKTAICGGFPTSGRLDLNQRPFGPQPKNGACRCVLSRPRRPRRSRRSRPAARRKHWTMQSVLLRYDERWASLSGEIVRADDSPPPGSPRLTALRSLSCGPDPSSGGRLRVAASRIPGAGSLHWDSPRTI
jgi:hypothetical protein